MSKVVPRAGAVTVTVRAVGLSTCACGALSSPDVTCPTDLHASPRTSLFTLVLPRRMSSVAAHPEQAKSSPTPGIPPRFPFVTPSGNASAVFHGGVDVAAKHVSRRRSATPTTPSILLLFLVGRVGGVGADAEVEGESSSAASTPSIPSAVGVALNVGGIRTDAMPTSLLALFLTAAVDVVAKCGTNISSATPTSAPTSAPFADDAKGRFSSSFSLACLLEAFLLLLPVCILHHALSFVPWEDTHAWVGTQFVAPSSVSGQAGSLGHCYPRGGGNLFEGRAPAARISSVTSLAALSVAASCVDAPPISPWATFPSVPRAGTYPRGIALGVGAARGSSASTLAWRLAPLR